MSSFSSAVEKVGVFGKGMWRYWRSGEPSPESNEFVQKLYALTDGRSNDILFRILESRRRETALKFGWDGESLISDAGADDPSLADVVHALKQDGIAVLPFRLKPEVVQGLYELALTGPLQTITFGRLGADQVAGTQTELPIAERGTVAAFDPTYPSHSVYAVGRDRLLENVYLQRLLCDPYLLAAATGYLGVFPVVTKPDMWWDTEYVPAGLRPRPFHTDSGCLRWLKVGINLTDTTFESPHFVYLKGSHRADRSTRPLTRRLGKRMNLSDREVVDVCGDRIMRVTASAGSITLADTRGIHKGELAARGNRLILYFGLEGSAFNNIDGPIPLSTVGSELDKAMRARPFSYQFFRAVH